MKKDNIIVPTKAHLTASIEACISNGDRLFMDGMTLEFEKPAATKLFLAMIAQEEFAKAFLLFMVHEDVIPWSKSLLRLMNDHICKQLVGIIIEHLDTLRNWKTLEELDWPIRNELEPSYKLPRKVADAINILRHDKIGRWNGDNHEDSSSPDYEPSTLRIAKGKKDRIKQDALYVRIGSNAQVSCLPTGINPTLPDQEFERARAYKYLVNSLVSGRNITSYEYKQVQDTFKAVFRTFEKNTATPP